MKRLSLQLKNIIEVQHGETVSICLHTWVLGHDGTLQATGSGSSSACHVLSLMKALNVFQRLENVAKRKDHNLLKRQCGKYISSF